MTRSYFDSIIDSTTAYMVNVIYTNTKFSKSDSILLNILYHRYKLTISMWMQRFEVEDQVREDDKIKI